MIHPHCRVLHHNWHFKNYFSKLKSLVIRNQRYGMSTNNLDFPVHLDTRKLQKYLNNIAVIDSNQSYTYGDIYSKSLHLQQLLSDRLQNKKSSCVSHLLPNDVSHVISQWATWNTGHIVVPLHPPHPVPQLKYYMDDSKSKVIITNEDLACKFSSLLTDYEVIVLEKDFLFKKESEIQAENIVAHECLTSEKKNLKLKDSPALILYTSGTTGPPKGVVLTHGILHFQLECLHKAWKWTSNDVILHCLPLHHVHGLVYALLCPISCGAKVIMEPKFNANAVWSKLLNLDGNVGSKVNLFMAVPTVYVKLIEEYEQNLKKNIKRPDGYEKEICMENIRLMISGSAPLPVTILEKWREITGHTILERYGMTEIGMALSNPLQGERRPGFVGSPLPGVQVKIVRFSPKKDSYVTLCEGNDVETVVSPGFEEESGDLLIKGPNVFLEYWEKEEATKKEFTKDGWFCTGDTAVFINGSYKLLGRTSVDIIKSGGFKISALDVERVLLAHSDIADVAVVGVPDNIYGEKVAALIVWKGKVALNETELRSWCKERLPHYQAPSVFKFFQSLPKNAVGKVNKKALVKEIFSP